MSWPKVANWSVALVMFTSLLLHTHGAPFSYTVNVAIKDVTGSDISVHCESKDDNIGTHTLHNNDILEWHFKPSVRGSTLFWCSFAWDHDGKALDARFIVWDWNTAPVFDLTNNGWKVAQDGFWLYDTTLLKWMHHHNWGFHEAKLEGLPFMGKGHRKTLGNPPKVGIKSSKE